MPRGYREVTFGVHTVTKYIQGVYTCTVCTSRAVWPTGRSPFTLTRLKGSNPCMYVIYLITVRNKHTLLGMFAVWWHTHTRSEGTHKYIRSDGRCMYSVCTQCHGYKRPSNGVQKPCATAPHAPSTCPITCHLHYNTLLLYLLLYFTY